MKPRSGNVVSMTGYQKARGALSRSEAAIVLVTEAHAGTALIRTNVADGDVVIEEVTLAHADDPANDEYHRYQWAEITASLKRGAWVDFRQEDGRFLRYKLAWISPLKKIYLFTNLSSQKALSVSPQAMEMQFRQGDAVLMTDAPLMDRAVENMLETLQVRSSMSMQTEPPR